MAQAVIVALIVAVIAPVLLSMLQGRQRRAEKREDWARQDEVAARVEAVAEQAKVAAARVEAVAVAAHDTNLHTRSELREIKTMVDGSLTASKRAELASTRRELVLLENAPPSTKIGEAMHAAQERIAELEREIAQRVETDRIAKAQAVDDLKDVIAQGNPEVPDDRP